jgi:hypothetical protein
MLAILDYGFNQPPVLLTKDVTFNIGADGKLSTSGNAVRTIKATIPITTPSGYVLQNELAPAHVNEVREKHLVGVQAGASLPPLFYPQPYQNTQPYDFQYLNQRLQLLNPIR